MKNSQKRRSARSEGEKSADVAGEGVGGADTVLGGERAQHLDLKFGEHDLRRHFGLIASEQGHMGDRLAEGGTRRGTPSRRFPPDEPAARGRIVVVRVNSPASATLVRRLVVEDGAAYLGAERIGIIQSLLATCRLHGVDPYTYLVDVLQRVGEHPAARAVELTPRMWKTLFADDPLIKSDLDRARDLPTR